MRDRERLDRQCLAELYERVELPLEQLDASRKDCSGNDSSADSLRSLIGIFREGASLGSSSEGHR